MLNLLGKIKLKYVGQGLKKYALAWTELRPGELENVCSFLQCILN